MLPLLIYPMMIPCLMAAMQLSMHLAIGEPVPPDEQLWIKMLLAFDAVFTALSLVLIETVLVG
jgi:heme exporter protein B